MKKNGFSYTCIFVLFILTFMNCGTKNLEATLSTANNLFREGKFDRAGKYYTKVLEIDSTHCYSIMRLGYIALLSNQLPDAEVWLKKAMELSVDEKNLNDLLAEVYYRQDRFSEAAPLFRAGGKDVLADKLQSFQNRTPYEIVTDKNTTVLPFVVTDPLPIVKVCINGSDTVNFFIDTGGAELIIDIEFAKEIGTQDFGAQMGMYAGGMKALFYHGRIDSLKMGNFTIKNIPVHISSVRRFSEPVFGGMRVDGIIGTVLLYHFISTLDYAKGQLVLQIKTPENSDMLANTAKTEGYIEVPFWMAGDHYMVAQGRANKGKPVMFFVDTGLAGGGFVASDSLIQEAGIELQHDQAGEGIGGGGKVTVIPFKVDRLSLGDAVEHNIQGLNTPGPFGLENTFGFRIGGIISHQFFRPYTFTLDFDKMKYYLCRSKDL